MDLPRDNHYTPRSYLNRWSSESGRHVWAYRLLVPTDRYPIWERRSTHGIAVHRDLYTSVATGEESTEVETWLSRSVESPAIPVLDRLTRGVPLIDDDRRKLARYIAALDARTPVGYYQHVVGVSEALDRELPSLLEHSINTALKLVESGAPVPTPGQDENNGPMSIRLRHDPAPDDPGRGSVDVSVTVGREMWLRGLRFIIDTVSHFLDGHDWQVLTPHPGWRWFTSDNPVIRLDAHENGDYNFEGRWGDRGTRILLPLSPSHLLYTRVGYASNGVAQMSLEETVQTQRIIAEHAYRWIIGSSAAKRAEWFAPRRVDLGRFLVEQEGVRDFHRSQSEAERLRREWKAS